MNPNMPQNWLSAEALDAIDTTELASLDLAMLGPMQKQLKEMADMGEDLPPEMYDLARQMEGALGALVNVGGDVRVRGDAPNCASWDVAVEDPVRPGVELLRIGLLDGAIATRTSTKTCCNGSYGDRCCSMSTGSKSREAQTSCGLTPASGTINELPAQRVWPITRLIRKIGSAWFASRTCSRGRMTTRMRPPSSATATQTIHYAGGFSHEEGCAVPRQ